MDEKKHNVEIPYKTDQEIEAMRQEELKAWRKRLKKAGRDDQSYAPGGADFYAMLHLTSVMMTNAERELTDHPSIFMDAQLYRRAVNIYDELFRLYQDLGALHGDAG